ncbi:MAG TPA: trypsin-like peptidase domain-containing protein, partial [Thermoguttaceae bacterium]|nr:trypsin-like peptidase domain-containing protein [Thermoguttaceae bacterium]
MTRRMLWAVGWTVVGFLGGIGVMGWLLWAERGKPVAAQEVQPLPPPTGGGFLGQPVLPPVGVPAPAKQDAIPNPEESPDLAELTPEERVNIGVYELCNRSVVHITTKSVREGALLLFAVEIPAEGEGSGVVLDRKGHILTNCHVVEGAQEIQVTLFNGKSYVGRLVGQDRVTDVAVLRIEAPPEELFPVMFGDSNRLRVGQRVYAIGNPFGFERTLSTGIISSLNRTLPSRSQARTIKNVIQIDAAINPGNSGGPLLNTQGRMIGMNTAIASRTGESAGVGFAIPVNTIARVVPQLIENGRVRRPDVGILRVYQTERGLLVAALAPGGAAEKAGIRGPQVIR